MEVTINNTMLTIKKFLEKARQLGLAEYVEELEEMIKGRTVTTRDTDMSETTSTSYLLSPIIQEGDTSPSCILTRVYIKHSLRSAWVIRFLPENHSSTFGGVLILELPSILTWKPGKPGWIDRIKSAKKCFNLSNDKQVPFLKFLGDIIFIRQKTEK